MSVVVGTTRLGDNASIASNARSARTGTGRASPSTQTSRLPSRRSSMADHLQAGVPILAALRRSDKQNWR
ncbi:MAG TPA: hypothetical protein VNC85_07780, partial [Mycobacteriales bacterium]|nr:hypothetical protein [Mycobacteriales bacterium]